MEVKLNSYQAKKLSLPDILSRLGHEPVKIQKSGIEYWYNSPFREEKDASFHTSYLGGKWIWNDFGDSGGTVIDFVMRYQNYNTVREALGFLDNLYARANFKAVQTPNPKTWQQNKLNIETLVLDQVKPLTNIALQQYLTRERAINLRVGKKYLQEAYFHNTENNKKYFALAMQNDSGGYEIRNPFFKSSLGGKDMTLIKGSGKQEICVYEGYMDFLSFLTDQNKLELQSDVLILNSISFTNKAKNYVTEHSYNRIYTFFDNDPKGQETFESFEELPIKVTSLNHLYQGFKDYNQFLQNKQKSNNIHLK